MFSGCVNLAIAPELPATKLSDYCYSGMFRGCSSLTTAPKLPAITLASYCYSNMFYNCSSLTSAPELPATTLASNCYYYMFAGCTNLKEALELPATTLASWCYSRMFNGCSKLNKITMLATDISASNCLTYWVQGVATTGTFIKNAAMTSLPRGENGIPNGWTVYNCLITFTIDGVEYQAEGGMTWEEYVNSEYNTIPLIMNMWGYMGDVNGKASIRIYDDGTYYDVSRFEKIIPNYNYILFN